MKIGVVSLESSWHFQDLLRANNGQHELAAVDLATMGGLLGPQQELKRFDALLVRGIPAGSLQQVVTRMDLLHALELEGATVINPPRSVENSIDKYLCLCRLQQAGLNVPRSAIFQTHEGTPEFLESHQKLVSKPLFGSEGRGLEILESAQQLSQHAQSKFELSEVLFVQEFVQATWDIRLFVIGDQVIGMSRHNDNDWRKNISLGGRGQIYKPSQSECELALTACAATGVRVAGVDVLISDDHGPMVIEVNSSPSWKYISKLYPEMDFAKSILDYIETVVTE